MRDGYFNIAHGATVDLIKSSDSTLVIITRVMVTKSKRGNGYASELMARVLEDADDEGVLLMLSIEEGDGLSALQLQEWYERLGFELLPGSDTTMVRRPVGHPLESLPYTREPTQ